MDESFFFPINPFPTPTSNAQSGFIFQKQKTAYREVSMHGCDSGVGEKGLDLLGTREPWNKLSQHKWDKCHLNYSETRK